MWVMWVNRENELNAMAGQRQAGGWVGVEGGSVMTERGKNSSSLGHVAVAQVAFKKVQGEEKMDGFRRVNSEGGDTALPASSWNSLFLQGERLFPLKMSQGAQQKGKQQVA